MIQKPSPCIFCGVDVGGFHKDGCLVAKLTNGDKSTMEGDTSNPVNVTAVTLNNGMIIHDFGDGFPPLQEVVEIDRACDICPVRLFCQDNNEFDCQTYGMFSGFYFGLDDALCFVKSPVEFLLGSLRGEARNDTDDG